VSEWWETLVLPKSSYNTLTHTNATIVGLIGLPLFLDVNDPVFNIDFVPLFPVIAMVGFIHGAQGMNFPTKIKPCYF
jgi:hypothetical protein